MAPLRLHSSGFVTLSLKVLVNNEERCYKAVLKHPQFSVFSGSTGLIYRIIFNQSAASLDQVSLRGLVALRTAGKQLQPMKTDAPAGTPRSSLSKLQFWASKLQYNHGCALETKLNNAATSEQHARHQLNVRRKTQTNRVVAVAVSRGKAPHQCWRSHPRKINEDWPL